MGQIKKTFTRPRFNRNKFGAQKTTVDGITFDSKGEAARYSTLKTLERAGTIKDLCLQVKFDLKHRGKKICTYAADFTYFCDDLFVVEDFKSAPTRTAEYRLKKKMMKIILGIEIYETEKPTAGVQP